MYRERPSSAHPGVTVWTRGTGTAPDRPARILPDGCLDLIWTDGALLVAGPDTRAHLMLDRADAYFAGLRFAPGTGPLLLGIPASELRDQRVPLASIWNAPDVRRLEEHIAAAGESIEAAAAALEHAAVTRLRSAAPPDPVTRAVTRGLASGTSVAETARAVGLSDRQLLRRSLAAYGYGPKTLARILRFTRALDLARAGTEFAAVAAATGYSDQAHLARDVRELAGLPLSGLLGA